MGWRYYINKNNIPKYWFEKRGHMCVPTFTCNRYVARPIHTVQVLVVENHWTCYRLGLYNTTDTGYTAISTK